MALSLPETVEKSHVGHPDFRVKGGRIFATLGYPDEHRGVLILTTGQQNELIGRYPEMFEPVKGGWGKRGSTQVQSSETGCNRISDEDGMDQRCADKVEKSRR